MTRNNITHAIALTRALIAFAVLALAADRSVAESYPIEVESETLDGSPFQIQVEEASAIADDAGDLSLQLRYLAENLDAEALAVQGFTLLVFSEEGELKGNVSVARSAQIPGGGDADFVYTLGAEAVTGLSLSDRVVVQTTTSSSATCHDGQTSICDSSQFLCESRCNNPLGGGGGVRSVSCGDCTLDWNDELGCWVEHCFFDCQCNEVVWPDQMPAYIDWFSREPPRY